MDQDPKDPEQAPEPTPEPAPEPEPQPAAAADMIEKANVAAARLEKANKELESLLVKQEQLKVEQTLSGTTDAGTKKRKTKDELEIEGAKKLLAGSGYEHEIFEKEV